MRSKIMEVRMAALVRKMEDVLRAERARRQKVSANQQCHQYTVSASQTAS